MSQLTEWNGDVVQKDYFVEFTASQLLCNDAVSQFINVGLEEKGEIKLTQGIRTIKTVGCEKAEAPQACNFIKKRLWHRCFPVNFAKFLRTPFSQDTSGGFF